MKVAVYGSLRKGMGNHKYHLGDAKYLGTEQTSEKFKMFSLGGFPAVVPDCRGYPVTVEVYEIDEAYHLPRLDRLEGYPHFYNRMPMSTSHGEAWIYYIDSPDRSFQTEVNSGDWVEFYNQRYS